MVDYCIIANTSLATVKPLGMLEVDKKPIKRFEPNKLIKQHMYEVKLNISL